MELERDRNLKKMKKLSKGGKKNRKKLNHIISENQVDYPQEVG